MKNKTIIFIILLLLIIPSVAWGANKDITFFYSGITPGDELNTFFYTILEGLLNIIAFLGVLFIVISGVVYLIAANTGNDAMLGTAKTILTGSLLGLILALSGPTLMTEIKNIIVGIGGTMPTDLGTSTPTLTEIIGRALKFLLSIIATIAIISLVVNSILYLLSAGDSSRAEQIKKNIKFSIIGFIVAGSALILVQQIVDFIQN